MQVVSQHPLLRNGAFSNSLEEWAEAAITLEWAKSRRVLSIKEIAGGMLTNHEYIGALSDFTGEVGRMAVAFASKET